MPVPLAELFVTVGADVSAAVAGLGRVESAMKSTAAGLTRAGTALTAGVTVPIVAAGTAIFKTGAEFETSMAGVRKTAGLTQAETAALGDELVALSKTIQGGGLDAGQLAAIAKDAGQLGIAKEDIRDFTALAAQLSGATGIAADQVGEDFARVALLSNTPREAWENAASAIVDLGNKLQGSEADILSTAKRIAGPLAAVGVSPQDILGTAGAAVAVGLEPEAGSTAIVKTYLDLIEAASGVNKVTDEQRTKMEGLNDRIVDLNSQLETAVAKQSQFGRNTPASVVQANADAIERYKREIGQANEKLGELGQGSGAKQLAAFAKVAGVTQEQFKAMVKANPTSAFDAVIDGFKRLKQTGGAEAVNQALNDLGFTEVRQRLLILNLANAEGDVLTNALGIANDAWAENTALATENAIAAETTERQIGLVARTLEGELIEAWKALKPVVADALAFVNDQIIPKFQELVKTFRELTPEQQLNIVKWLAFAAAIGPALIAIAGVITLVGLLITPIGAAIVIVGLLAAAWTTNFMNIQGVTERVVHAIQAAFSSLKSVIFQILADIAGRLSEAFAAVGNTLPVTLGQPLKEQAANLAALQQQWQAMATLAGNEAIATGPLTAAVAPAGGALTTSGQPMIESGATFNAPVVHIAEAKVDTAERVVEFAQQVSQAVLTAIVEAEKQSQAPVGQPLPGAPFGTFAPSLTT